jgi:hypothetical protein
LLNNKLGLRSCLFIPYEWGGHNRLANLFLYLFSTKLES